MSALPTSGVKMTEAEYLEFERASELKHELIDGEIVDMTGASFAHNVINLNVATALRNQLRGRPCSTVSSDMRVKMAKRNYAYPDTSVVCGDPQFGDNGVDTLLNPTLIIEVLSPSTERYDRGKKFQAYREIEWLQEYVLIAQDSPRIERYVRQEHGFWQFADVSGLAAQIELVSINCTLALAEVYEQVTFTADDAPPSELS